MKVWKASITPEMIEAENQWHREQRKVHPKKKNPKLYRDETKPRRPLNGFIQFCEEVRSDSSRSNEVLGVADANDIPIVEQTKGLSAAWKAMSEEDKKPYNDRFAKDKQEYEEAMEKWKASKADGAAKA